MKRKIQKLSADDLLKDYPIISEAEGWYLSVTEVSNGCYSGTGIDLWGRKIKTTGSEPEQIIRKLNLEAMSVNESND